MALENELKRGSNSHPRSHDLHEAAATMTEPQPMVAHARAHTILTIDNWLIWDRQDPDFAGAYPRKDRYAMFHKCDNKGTRAVSKRYDGSYMCNQCDHVVTPGLVVAYEFMMWEANGYGG